jgi:prephenate dehydrogenase
MKELLPPTCHYVGLTPAINPDYLGEVERGIRAAHADLFARGVMAVAAPQGTGGAAVKLAADLSALLGAAPFFVDLLEVDGMMAGLHIMPQLYAAALANVAMGNPGWGDARKLAGRVYAEATAPVAYDEEGGALVEAALQDSANVTRVIDEMIIALKELREDISNQEREKLTGWLQRARQGRSRWWRERGLGDWLSTGLEKVELPKSDLWKRLFGNLGKLFGPPKPGKGEQKQ